MILLNTIDLIIAALLLLVLAGIDMHFKMGHAKPIIINAARSIIQLLLLGLVLKLVFENQNLIWMGLIVMLMLLVAGHEVRARQKRRFKGFHGYVMSTLSMLISSFTITVFSLVVILQPSPWYEAQYAIPLLGMLLGNTMTGVALTMAKLTEDAWTQKAVIEQRLMLGQTPNEAIADIRKQSMHNGLIPGINMMAAEGIVSIPGMMTGQILAGNDPLEAAKYQILILFLIVAGSGLGSLTAVWLGGIRLFDDRDRLRLDRLQIF